MPWMPTPGARDAHPARAERVRRPGRHRLQPLRPRARGRRVPPRVLPLDDDVEGAARRRVDRLAGRDGERAPELRRRRRAYRRFVERLIMITCANASAETAGATLTRVHAHRRAVSSRRARATMRCVSFFAFERAARAVAVDHGALAAEGEGRVDGAPREALGDRARPRCGRRRRGPRRRASRSSRARRCAPSRRPSRRRRTRRARGSSTSRLRSTTTASGRRTPSARPSTAAAGVEAADPHARDPDAGRESSAAAPAAARSSS